MQFLACAVALRLASGLRFACRGQFTLYHHMCTTCWCYYYIWSTSLISAVVLASALVHLRSSTPVKSRGLAVSLPSAAPPCMPPLKETRSASSSTDCQPCQRAIYLDSWHILAAVQTAAALSKRHEHAADRTAYHDCVTIPGFFSGPTSPSAACVYHPPRQQPQVHVGCILDAQGWLASMLSCTSRAPCIGP
jgi:hypothetical protein